MKKLRLMFLISIIFLAGCSYDDYSKDLQIISESQVPSWFNFQLKDLATQQLFTLNDFKAKMILLESFAVWCPVATLQEREIKWVYESQEFSLVPISLDTDPNEPESKIIKHMTENDFTWTYAHSPPELTRDLIKEFGVGIVNAPSAPIILICPDQSYKVLEKKGIKSSLDLKQALDTCT